VLRGQLGEIELKEAASASVASTPPGVGSNHVKNTMAYFVAWKERQRLQVGKPWPKGEHSTTIRTSASVPGVRAVATASLEQAQIQVRAAIMTATIRREQRVCILVSGGTCGVCGRPVGQ
jgi:hypothetical protein